MALDSSPCPFAQLAQGAVRSAIEKCPFLHTLSSSHGPEFARSIAVNPTQPAILALRKGPILEEYDTFSNTFKLFHGPSGVMPLPSYNQVQAKSAAEVAATNPSAAYVRSRLAAAPLAAISFGMPGNMPNFGDFFQRKPKPKHQKKKPEKKPESSQRSAKQSFNSALPTSSMAASSGTGQCPLRKVLGPFAHVVFSKSGNLHCPEPIVRARAALSRTELVQTLRPQDLQVKIAAVAALTAALNVPCGAIREHFEKFSFGWFVAIHATIPFVAMFRKAVILPKYAIAITIAAAVAGQVIGSRLERKRISGSRRRSAERSVAMEVESASALSPAIAHRACAPCDLVGLGSTRTALVTV